MNPSKMLVGACASIVLLGAGCIPTPQNLIQGAIENKINSELGTDGSVKINDDGVSVTDKTDGSTTSFGENVKLPENFPNDVPIIDGAKVAGVAVTKAQGAWVTLTTDKSVDDVANWYHEKLTSAGFEQTATYSTSEMVTKSYQKDRIFIDFVVTAGSEGDPTSIMLTETEE